MKIFTNRNVLSILQISILMLLFSQVLFHLGFAKEDTLLNNSNIFSSINKTSSSYGNDNLGFKMVYPNNWTVADEGFSQYNWTVTNNDLFNMIYSSIYYYVVFLPKNLTEFGGGLEIIASHIKDNITLEQYLLNELSHSSSILRNYIGDSYYQLIPKKIDEKPAFTIIDDYYHGVNSIIIKNENIVYQIYYPNILETLPYQKTIQNIINSIKFVSSPPVMTSSILIEKNPIIIGDQQNITIYTFEKNSKEIIPDASFDISIEYSSGLPMRFSAHTDDLGRFSYVWNIFKDTKPGNFLIKIIPKVNIYSFANNNLTTFAEMTKSSFNVVSQ